MTSAGRPTLTFLSCNARSLFTKMEELRTVSSQLKPLFITIQETWCMADEADSAFHLPDYILFRRDRRTTGGGVCIYCRCDAIASVERLPNFESQNEDLWVLLKLKNSLRPLLVCTIYRPPNYPLDTFFQELDHSLTRMSQAYSQSDLVNTVITGDFNARCAEWCASDRTDDAGERLHQLTASFGLQQLTSFKTNLVAGELRACLDLVFTNYPAVTVTSFPPLGSSDHLMLAGKLVVDPDEARRTKGATGRTVWRWSKGDIKGLLAAISSTDWSDVLSSREPDSALRTWSEKILALTHQFVPTRPARQTAPPCPWMTPELASNIKQKHKLFKTYKKRRTPDAWTTFTIQRNLVSSLLRKAKSAYVRTLPDGSEASSVRAQLPRLHRLLNSLTRAKHSPIPALLTPDGRPVTSAIEKAEMLNEFFLSQSQRSAGVGLPPEPSSPRVTNPADRLTAFTVAEPVVTEELRRIDVTKSAGNDRLPSCLLRLAAEEITPCVCHIFRISLEAASFPRSWKEAVVIPCFKRKGSSLQPTNYRPISLLPVLSKVFERIILRQLYDHVDEYLPVNQSGFRRKDGTELQLARLVHRLAKGVDEGKHILSCHYDLSKAFDCVWHAGLVTKLHHLGVSGPALEWIKSYLSGRSQRVKIDGVLSASLPVSAGVPQGSVLGPLMYLVYTHDLPYVVSSENSTCDQFADDTALTSICDTGADAVRNLQISVTETGKWLSDWRLSVNLSKTVVMETTRRARHSQATITLNGVALQHVASQKHLGLLLTSDLRWSAHVAQVLAQATPRLHTLRRLRSSLTTGALSYFYKLYIRPKLEYASMAWASLPQHLIDRLERFQRRAARIILRRPLFEHGDHDELLNTLGWETLSSRRVLRQAVLGHRLAKRDVPPHLQNVIFPRRESSYHLRSSEHFLTPIPNTFLYQTSPIFSASVRFNHLPLEVQSAANFIQAAKIHVLTSLCSCSEHVLRQGRR